MFYLIEKTQSIVDKIVSRSSCKDPQERVRLNHYVWISLFTLPIAILAVFYNISIYNFSLAALITCFTLFSFSTLFFLHKINSPQLLYYALSMMYLFLVLYMLYYVELCDNSKILWAYAFPLGAIFLFGNRIGFVWSMVLLLLIIILFVISEKIQTIYLTSFQIRFAITYFVVASMTSWIEYYRHRYQNESLQSHKVLLIQQKELESEIERRVELEKQLTYLAQTDSLTQVFNRYYFWQRAQTELERSQRYNIQTSLAVLDIDYFKTINDTYGHPIGDKVLQTLSDYCTKSLRTSDIFARIGGEEFAFLLLHVNLDEAHAKMEILRQEIESIIVSIDNKSSLSFTVSIGISMLDETISSLDQLYKLADAQLYLAKNSGRNCIC